jgi:hypothetical protein
MDSCKMLPTPVRELLLLLLLLLPLVREFREILRGADPFSVTWLYTGVVTADCGLADALDNDC